MKKKLPSGFSNYVAYLRYYDFKEYGVFDHKVLENIFFTPYNVRNGMINVSTPDQKKNISIEKFPEFDKTKMMMNVIQVQMTKDMLSEIKEGGEGHKVQGWYLQSMEKMKKNGDISVSTDALLSEMKKHCLKMSVGKNWEVYTPTLCVDSWINSLSGDTPIWALELAFNYVSAWNRFCLWVTKKPTYGYWVSVSDQQKIFVLMQKLPLIQKRIRNILNLETV